MKTISQIIREIINQSPFLEEAIREDIVNTSKVARKIRKKAEERLMVPISEASILMALRRMPQSNAVKNKRETLVKVSDIVVRSGLIEYIFNNSQNLTTTYQQIFKKIVSINIDSYFNIIRGNYETLVIINNKLEDYIDDLLKNQKTIRKIRRLSSITIRLPEAKITSTGIYYPFLQKIAWEGISIVEIFSVAHELTFIFEEKDIDRAFAIIKFLSQS
ncbi:MAG: hypothetical protein WCV92_03620 [Candidatus Buchananbacteria bacterium]